MTVPPSHSQTPSPHEDQYKRLLTERWKEKERDIIMERQTDRQTKVT